MTRAVRTVTLVLAFVVWATPGAVGRDSLPPADGVVTVDSRVVHQTMRGWEAHAEAGPMSFDPLAAGLFDQAAAIGINRVQLAVRSGSEHSADSYGAWKAAGFPTQGTGYDTWRARRYETVNDNGNPASLNESGFHFTELDDTIARIVAPMRSRLQARGERLFVSLTYVAFTRQITSGQPYIHANPAEYAEFMLAAFSHLQQRHGWVPDAIEVILEPDNVPEWPDGVLIGQSIVATGQLLAARGFRPDFIGPSTTCMGNAIKYIDGMLSVSGIKTYLRELSYHRYCQVSTANLQTIADRAREHGLATSMLEWWNSGNTYSVLHEDLKTGLNSAQQQSPFIGSSGTELFRAVGSSAVLGSNTRFTRHYYRHVRMGARRIGAESSLPRLDPLAFINQNGAYAIVIKVTGAASFDVQGLPAGTYAIRYTTQSESDVGHADQTIAAGQPLSTGIPAAGVLEIFHVSETAPLPPAPMPGALSARRRPPSAPSLGRAVPRTSVAPQLAAVANGVEPASADAANDRGAAATVSGPVRVSEGIWSFLRILLAASDKDDDAGLRWWRLQMIDTDGNGEIDTVVVETSAAGVIVFTIDGSG